MTRPAARGDRPRHPAAMVPHAGRRNSARFRSATWTSRARTSIRGGARTPAGGPTRLRLPRDDGLGLEFPRRREAMKTPARVSKPPADGYPAEGEDRPHRPLPSPIGEQPIGEGAGHCRGGREARPVQVRTVGALGGGPWPPDRACRRLCPSAWCHGYLLPTRCRRSHTGWRRGRADRRPATLGPARAVGPRGPPPRSPRARRPTSSPSPTSSPVGSG